MQKLRSQSRLVICKPASLQIPILLASICFLNFSLVCTAAIIKVPENYSIIQSAINAAFDGDEIIVSPGTYYENINVNGKNIILRSTDPTSATVVASTVINGRSSVVWFSGRESPSCILSGFTITNGNYFKGSGIYGSGTRATIENNHITTNTTYGFSASYSRGGGIWNCDGLIQNNVISGNRTTDSWGAGGGLAECDGVIRNNIITGNSATGTGATGGGLYNCNGTIEYNTISGNWARSSGGGLAECSAIIRNNIISNNKSYRDGGGLAGCNGIIGNNTIWGNSASEYSGDGGGLYDCDGVIQNNTIYGNTAKSGGGLYECRGFITNCIIWGNSASYGSQIAECRVPFSSCIQGWTYNDRANISDDPRFIDPGNGNFHIPPDSPCIDAGNTYYLLGQYLADIDGECRVAGSSVDMGNDECGSSPDNDGDLLSDANEADHGSDPNKPDTDGDGLKDGLEVQRGTDPNFYNTPTGISIPAQYSSIQQALFFAFPSETVTVSPGIYEENLHFLGKNLILRSTNPLDDNTTSNTIIDGGLLSAAITFKGTENESCMIKGFTIQNGARRNGGGIRGNGTLATIQHNKIFGNYAQQGSGIFGCQGTIEKNVISGNFAGGHGTLYGCNGTIRDNIISNNTAIWSGGGLCDCDGLIENNSITDNHVRDSNFSFGGGLSECDGTIQNNNILRNHCSGFEIGGGGGLAGCNGTIQNNVISENIGSGIQSFGGGLSGCSGIILNNIISGNSAQRGGGLSSSDGFIANNTIWGNSAHWYGGGLYKCPGRIRNCIIWQNTASADSQLHDCPLISYSCIQDWADGTGNISSDPLLVNPSNGDFHLLASSPCIDAGCLARWGKDFEGDPRPWDATSEQRGDGSNFDIGADEFVGPVEFDFVLSREGWTTGTAPIFTAPKWIFETGCVKLVSQNNTNTFGYWSTSANAIPVTQNYLYRAQFVVSTDVTQPELVPQIRLRVNSRNFQQADCLTIDSNGDGGASPTPEGTTYDLYFVPPANEQFCMLAFDLLNFTSNDAPDAELALDSVLIDRFRLDTLDDSAGTSWTYDFEASQGFWLPGDAAFVFSAPESFWEDGALHLRSTTNTNTFGYWGSDPTDITIEENRLYRGTFEVRTDETNRSRVPQMRLRFNAANLQACRSLEIASSDDGANSPGTTNTTYDRLYFLPPANCVGEDLLISFDILNFNPGDAPTASLILDRAVIESLSPPGSP